MIHAHHFTDCSNDLESMAGMHDRRWNTLVCRWIVNAISHGERFYLPSDFEILKERKVDPELKSVLRLPFPVVVAFKTIQDASRDTPFHTMNIALSGDLVPDEVKEKFSHVISGQHYFILAAFKSLPEEKWATFPAIGVCSFGDPSSDGFDICQLPLADGLDEEDLEYFNKATMMRLNNLFAMLGLVNVKKTIEEVPKKLNVKRSRNGKLPLYSYHVLEVDGEKWSAETSMTDPDHPGVRSHMRRGHIRRLDEQRKVWVRATMVHGKRPGFVDKEYHTKTGIT